MPIRVGISGFGYDHAHIRIDAVLIIQRLSVLGPHTLEPCSPVGDPGLGNHHHTTAAQTYASAEINGFPICGEPWVDAFGGSQCGQRHQSACQIDREHVLSPIILFLIGFAIHHQGCDIVVTGIQTDVVQRLALPVKLFGTKQRCRGSIAPGIQQRFQAVFIGRPGIVVHQPQGLHRWIKIDLADPAHNGIREGCRALDAKQHHADGLALRHFDDRSCRGGNDFEGHLHGLHDSAGAVHHHNGAWQHPLRQHCGEGGRKEAQILLYRYHRGDGCIDILTMRIWPAVQQAGHGLLNIAAGNGTHSSSVRMRNAMRHARSLRSFLYRRRSRSLMPPQMPNRSSWSMAH